MNKPFYSSLTLGIINVSGNEDTRFIHDKVAKWWVNDGNSIELKCQPQNKYDLCIWQTPQHNNILVN